MKKLINAFYILAITFLLFCLYDLYQINQQINYLERVHYLINEGYTRAAADHIAKVEFKLIPEDEEYISLMED